MKYSGFDTMSKWKYPFYILLHPTDGFQELRYNKKGSKRIVLVILLLWFLEELLYKFSLDFDFNHVNASDVNIVMLLFSTAIVFFVGVTANWCFCTLMDGKGTFKDICVVIAYALIPYIASGFFTVLLSHMFTLDEGTLVTYLRMLAMVWSVLIGMCGLSVIHEYSATKTVLSVLLTILGMLIILFIAFLCFMLMQQLVLFVSTLRLELIGR